MEIYCVITTALWSRVGSAVVSVHRLLQKIKDIDLNFAPFSFDRILLPSQRQFLDRAYFFRWRY